MFSVKRLCLMVLLSVCLCLTLAFPVSAAANDAVVDARQGVVRILAVGYDGSLLGHGSGFAVGVEGQKVDTFITNWHVAGAPDVATAYVVLDYIGQGGTYLEASIIKTWSSPDLAIISLSTPISTWTPLPLMSSEYVKPTQDIYALGFPGTADTLNDLRSRYPSTYEDVTITKGIISKEYVQVDGAAYYQIDATINGGNSGGPLLTEDGAVIGVNTVGVTRNGASTGTNGAVHIDYIMEALDGLKIPYTTVTPEVPDPASDDDNSSQAASDSSAASSSSASASSAASSSASQSQSTDQSAIIASNPVLINKNPGTNWLAIAAIVVIAILAAIIAIPRLRLKNQPHPVEPPIPLDPGTQTTPIAPTPQPALLNDVTVPVTDRTVPVSTMRLVGVSGQFASADFPLNDHIVIGRNPRECGIVFANGTPGVSSIHCEVQNVRGKPFLIDRGSSYGTFIHDDIKLEPGQPHPLENADSFYLGSADNKFEIRY